jgi:hypothetical protein
MNGYRFKVSDPYTTQVSTVLVFAPDEITACSILRTAAAEVNGAGLQVNFQLIDITEMSLAG